MLGHKVPQTQAGVLMLRKWHRSRVTLYPPCFTTSLRVMTNLLHAVSPKDQTLTYFHSVRVLRSHSLGSQHGTKGPRLSHLWDCEQTPFPPFSACLAPIYLSSISITTICLNSAYYALNCVPHPQNNNLHYNGIWRWGLQEITRVRWGHEGRAPDWDLCPYKKRKRHEGTVSEM